MEKRSKVESVCVGTDNGSMLTIGKTDFRVSVHFGKIPLEEILRQRILRECTTNV